jgi:hypothetical protein
VARRKIPYIRGLEEGARDGFQKPGIAATDARPDVRYGSLADIVAALPNVRFTPKKQTSPSVVGMSA